MQIITLTNAQRKQLLNVQQVFEAYETELWRGTHSFDGSLGWSSRGDKEYLIRKRKSGAITKSLGARSPETEAILAEFEEGRREHQQRLRTLAGRLEAMAPTNLELHLGRVPSITARVCRRLSASGVLGKGVRIVGTNALFAYEAAAGVQFHGSLTATDDADLLVDVRRRLRILDQSAHPAPADSLLQLIRTADPSFRLAGHKDTSYRLVNDEGFAIELVRSMSKDELLPRHRLTATANTEDLQPVPVPGMHWLRDAPPFTAIAIDDRGFPLRLEAPDPRAFALVKEWVAERPDRDPLKKPRDRAQSQALFTLLATTLQQLPEDGVNHMPAAWRTRLQQRMDEARLHQTTAENAPVFDAEQDVARPSWY